LISNWVILLAAICSIDLARAAETCLPDNCRLAVVLERAFWNYANPTNPGTVTVYVERRAGEWDPTFSADAQRGLNVAHDGYLVASSSEPDAEVLRVRLHIRRDRWMDVVGEPAYRVAEHDLYGCPQAWTTHSTPARDGSGVVTLNMDEVYQVEENKRRKDIGIRAVRSFAVDYSGASGAPCLVAVADRLTGTQGSNTWQMAIPRELDAAVAGNTFTVTAKSGETLKGTVVRPANAKIRAVDYDHVHEINYHGGHSHGKFLRRAVLASGADKDQDFLVVMTLQRGDTPACEVKDGRAHVGKQTVSFDGEKLALGVFAGP
jgi:hypothetical protein